MSNADGNIIPIVEDDKTGETYQEVIEDLQENIRETMAVPNHFLKETIPKSATQCKCEQEQIIKSLANKLNKIMIALGCDDKDEIMIVGKSNDK